MLYSRYMQLYAAPLVMPDYLRTNSQNSSYISAPDKPMSPSLLNGCCQIKIKVIMGPDVPYCDQLALRSLKICFSTTHRGYLKTKWNFFIFF